MDDRQDPREKFESADLHRRVLAITETLHGLPVAKADYVLQQCRRLIGMSCIVNTQDENFATMVRDFEKTYGEPYEAPQSH